MVPLASINRANRGIALDGHLKDEDVNLASSTLVQGGKTHADAIGIVISYSVRVKLNCGTLGGELVTDVPLKLLHPAPGTRAQERANSLKKLRSVDRSKSQSIDDDFVFEDFARMRMNE